jgi:hypothetical protein
MTADGAKVACLHHQLLSAANNFKQDLDFYEIRYENHAAKVCLTVPWLRRLVADLSQRNLGFAPGPVHVGFVVK